jgi:hypothetical protein
MPQERAPQRVPEGVMMSQAEWDMLSERSRRFLVATVARYNEMERLAAARRGGNAGAREPVDRAGTQPPEAEGTAEV